MSDTIQNVVAPGHDEHVLLTSKSTVDVAITRAMPGITILIHGVNDVGEAFPYQEQGICQGLNERLKRKDIIASTYGEPEPENGDSYTPDDVLKHPDPDREYYRREPASTTSSPIIPFYWGFREVTKYADTTQKHGQYLDRFGNRLDKRYGKNGGPFANATTTIPDMFGKGFNRNLMITVADFIAHTATHPLLTAPPRNYMVLAAQRMASLIRIIRKQSPNEPLNIVAHSQGCFVTLLAHAMLAKEGNGVRADTVVLNNPPYSVDEPGAEKTQTGFQQQTSHAREETLRMIVEYITKDPANVPKFADLETLCAGLVGPEWKINDMQRDNRGKAYLYFSPDDCTVGLPNIEGIGWWGVYNGLREKLGSRFFQRLFAAPTGANPDAPKVGAAPQRYELKFKLNKGYTFPRDRLISGEKLPEPFVTGYGIGDAELYNTRIDAAIASTDPSKGMGPKETIEQAQARWLGQKENNSYHSSILMQPEHSRKATAWDISIGVSGILKDNDLKWINFLRAVADWRTNWKARALIPKGSNVDSSFPQPLPEVLEMLSAIDPKEKEIIDGNYDYYADDERNLGGTLPEFTTNCKKESLTPYLVSETVAARAEEVRREREASAPEAQRH